MLSEIAFLKLSSSSSFRRRILCEIEIEERTRRLMSALPSLPFFSANLMVTQIGSLLGELKE